MIRKYFYTVCYLFLLEIITLVGRYTLVPSNINHFKKIMKSQILNLITFKIKVYLILQTIFNPNPIENNKLKKRILTIES